MHVLRLFSYTICNMLFFPSPGFVAFACIILFECACVCVRPSVIPCISIHLNHSLRFPSYLYFFYWLPYLFKAEVHISSVFVWISTIHLCSSCVLISHSKCKPHKDQTRQIFCFYVCPFSFSFCIVSNFFLSFVMGCFCFSF